MEEHYEKLQKEMTRYEEYVKSILPIEEELRKLKRTGMSVEEIKTLLGKNSSILEYVPGILYHGSSNNLEVINPKESTQKGSYVYATDNPIHALFFSIFRNSSIARGHIHEYINENGEYRVKYQIDERVAGALNEIISDKFVTIHICDGKQFFKPHGEAYINREWLSKDGQSIVPVDRIHVNVKQIFSILEAKGLVEYSRYDKSKDWKTVMDLLGQNYPFGLGTARASNVEEFDLMYDDFIGTHFPEQLEFSKQFRIFIKEVMDTDYKAQNPNLTPDDEINYKLKYIKSTADSFLLATKDEQGKVKYSVDADKINKFQNQYPLVNAKKRVKTLDNNSTAKNNEGFASIITFVLIGLLLFGVTLTYLLVR